MSSKISKVMLALSSDPLCEFVEQQLKKLNKLKLKISRASDLYALPDLIKSEQPDLVVLSPNIVGDAMIPLFKEKCGMPNLKTIAYCLTMTDESLLRNYDGKLLMTDSESESVDALEKVLLINESNTEETKEQQTLTPREKDIVACVVKGLTNKEIAAELFLSTHTVITHRRNIAKKLQIHSPAGLTIYAIVNKLVELSDIESA